MHIIEEAMIFAIHAHQGQVRKISKLPYILHPMEVATIASTMTKEDEVIVAALLHDTVEDTNTSISEIKEKFGKRVYQLVASETEDKVPNKDPRDSWMERKESTLLILKHTLDMGVKILWLSDKLANMRSFYRQYLLEGDKIWLSLNQKDKSKQEWYYRSILEYTSCLAEFPAYQEYKELVERVFKK